MNLSEKSKILVFYLASFFITHQAYSQCDFNIIEEADCGANGVVEFLPDPAWSSPYTYTLNYPNGNQDTGTFNSTPYLIDSLVGNSTDYQLVVSSGTQNCTLDISLTPYAFNHNLYIPPTNGYGISCNGLCDGQILSTPQPIPFQTQTVEFFADSASGTPLFIDSLISPQQFTFDSLCAGDYVVRYTSSTGCVREYTETLFEPDSLEITGTVTDVLCNSDSTGEIDVEITGGVGTVINSSGDSTNSIPYTYDWTGPNAYASSSEDISALPGGAYTLTVTDANSCTVTETFIVNDSVPPLAILLDSLVNISCHGANDGQIAISSSGGTSPYNFEWISGTIGNDSSLTGLNDAIYQVVLTDNNNCKDTSQFEIINPDTLSVTTSITDVACFGENTGAFSVDFFGGTPPYTITYISNSGMVDSITSNGLHVSSLTSGTYSFSVVDDNLCVYEDSVTIDENPDISLSFTNIVEETCNADNGSVTVDVNGGVPGYSYSWSNGETTSSINGVSGGANYTVQVTDNLNCTASDIVFVPITEAVLIKTVAVTDNTCFGDSLGSLSIETSGGLYPHIFTYTHLDSGHSFTATSSLSTTVISNLPSGDYSLSVQDNSGCQNTWSLPITVSENPLLTVSVDPTSTSMLSCNGDNDGKLFLTISGGNSFPGNYYWLFVSSPDFSQNLTTDSVVGLSAGTYSLTVQDADGCSTSLTHEIQEPLPLSTSHIVSNTNCYDESNGEVLVVVSGGTSNYTLSSSTFSNSNITSVSTDTFKIIGLSEGTYFYDIVDASGCQLLNNSFYVGEPSEVEIIDVTSTMESCLGYDATATVDVTGGVGGYTYFWTSDNSNSVPLVLLDGSQNPTVNASTVQNVTSGLIYVFVQDANSCSATDSVVISQSSSPDLHLLGTVDNLCDGDSLGQISLNATDGNPFYEFSINGGVNWQFLATFSGLPAGQYSAIVRDSLGCQDVISSITINSPPPISVSVSAQQVSCANFTDGSASVVAVNGGTSTSGTYSYSWQNSQGINLWPGNPTGINSTVNNLIPGTYQLEVEDDNGCTTLYSPVEIGEPLPVSVDLSIISDYNGVDISCFGYSDAIIQANANGGTGQYIFEWYNSTDTDEIRLSISPSFDTLSLVPQDTYSVVVKDSLGCTTSNSISVSHPSQIEVDFENIVHIRCAGNNDGQATAIYSGGLGIGNYNVSWTDSTNTVISLIAQATHLSVGDYVATYTDNNGCVGQDTVTINYSELFQVGNASDTTTVSCLGSIDASFNFNVMGGWQPYTYVWNDPLGQQSPTAIGLAPGQWYTNIITDANNCILIDSVYVTSPIDEVEVTSYTIVDNDCFENSNGSINVEVSGGSPLYDFDWSGPNFNSASQNISGLIVGTYNLLITDNNGCEKTYTYYVDGPNSPLQINSVNTNNVSCFGLQDGSANLNGQITGGTIPYVNQDWQGENPESLSAGDYTVEVTDGAGCQTSVSFTITEPDALSLTVDIIDEFCKGQGGQISAQVTGGTPSTTGDYTYDLQSTSFISPFFNYQSSGSNNADISIQFPENNNVADTLFLLTVTDENNCQITQNIEIHPARLFYSNETLKVCSSDTIVLSADRFADYETYVWTINPDQSFIENGSQIELVVNNSSTISVTAFDPSSTCFFTDELEIVELSPSIETNVTDIGIIMGESINLSINNGEEPYMWSTGETSSSIDVNPLITTNYVAYALDTATMCIGHDTIRVFVGMNEGFSPNGDGFNDTWKIDYLNQYESLQIEVFNRWGSSLWKSASPNIVNWDGKHNGKELPLGTYYYIIIFDDGTTNEPLTGPVTIVR